MTNKKRRKQKTLALSILRVIRKSLGQNCRLLLSFLWYQNFFVDEILYDVFEDEAMLCHRAPLLDGICRNTLSIYPWWPKDQLSWEFDHIFREQVSENFLDWLTQRGKLAIITPTIMLYLLWLAWFLSRVDPFWELDWACLVRGIGHFSSSSSTKRFLSMQSWIIFLKTKQWSVSCPVVRWNLQNWFLYFPKIVEGLVAFGSLTNLLVNMYSRTLSSGSSKGVKSRLLLQSLRFGFSLTFALVLSGWKRFVLGHAELSLLISRFLWIAALIALGAFAVAPAGLRTSCTAITLFAHWESDRCFFSGGSFSETGFSLLRQYLNHHLFEQSIYGGIDLILVVLTFFSGKPLRVHFSILASNWC